EAANPDGWFHSSPACARWNPVTSKAPRSGVAPIAGRMRFGLNGLALSLRPHVISPVRASNEKRRTLVRMALCPCPDGHFHLSLLDSPDPLSFGRREVIMIEDTVSKIEAKIQGADAINDDRKRELLQLLGTLKSEVAGLSRTHGEQAESIAGFTELSA